MQTKIFLSHVYFLSLFLGMGVGWGQEYNPVLSIRILEKPNPQQLEIQCPVGKGPWDEIKLTRGQMTVNGKPQSVAHWGDLEAFVEIKAGNLTRIYPGRIDVSTSPGEKNPELLILNHVPLTDYVACVTASESAYDRSQPEYLKVLAAVIRGFALSHLKRHSGYDLCDLAHCQVYQGMPKDFDFWRNIADASQEGSALLQNRACYFHQCCGGMLESAGDLWGGSGKVSRIGPDELNGKILCQSDPHYKWETSTDCAKLEDVLCGMENLPEGSRLTDLQILERTPQNRAKTFLAALTLPDGKYKEIHINAQRFISEFGKRYGWRVFPSLWFEIKRDGNLYRFSGHGFGHGVGLCQAGALSLAQMGWNWKEILKFYFPNI